MKEKSRVLILSTAYLPQIGGSELAIKNITDRLPGISFDLITSRPSKKIPAFEKIGNVNVYRTGGLLGLFSFLLPKNFLPILIFLKALELIYKNGPYSVIHAYQASQAAGGGCLLKCVYPRTPFLLTVQEGKDLSQQPWLTRLFRWFIFKKVDAATAISGYLAEYIKSQNQKISVKVIPNGVDLNKFQVKNEKLKINEKIIITVSRLVKKNGVGDLIEAIYELNANYRLPTANYRLLIVGGGPLAESLRTKVRGLKLEDKVDFISEVSNEELPKYLARADIFVRPSLSEGLGTAFLEAMAAGVPIIGTPVGGIQDFLKDGETGLFCKVGDPTDIADKIVAIFSDDELKNKLIINARKLVEEKYSWDEIAAEFDKLYQKTMNNEQ